MIVPLLQSDIAHLFVTGFLLSISLCLDIGIVNAAIIEAGARKGFLPAFLLGLGSCMGDLFYGALSVSGLAMLIRLPHVRTVLWVGGNCVLIVMIVSIARAAFRHGRSQELSPGREVPARVGHLGRGVFLSVVSPTSILWFTTVGSVVVASGSGGSPSLSCFFLSGFLLAGVTWSMLLAAASACSGRFLGQKAATGARLLSAVVLSALCLYSVFQGMRGIL